MTSRTGMATEETPEMMYMENRVGAAGTLKIQLLILITLSLLTNSAPSSGSEARSQLPAAMKESVIGSKFTVSEILSLDYGDGPYQIGFANGPGHTPYPESAQAIKVSDGSLAILDTFNGRLLKFSLSDGTATDSVEPKVDVGRTFYTGFAMLPDNRFAAFDSLNMAFILSGPAGDVLPHDPGKPPLSHVTGMFATDGGAIVAGDRGVGRKGLHVFNHSLDYMLSMKAEGLTEAGFAVDAKGRIHVALPRTGREAPTLQVLGATSENSEILSFSRLFTVSMKDTSFPDGSFNIAGIDGAGNYYLYWAGLAGYFDAPARAILGPDLLGLPDTQILALFNVFSPTGEKVADFGVPFSTAPEGAWVTPDGTLVVMTYDATGAPKGKVRILRCSRE